MGYDGQGEVPDAVPEGNEKRIVHMSLPLGVKVSVYQWNNYIDVQIDMSPQPSQDGVCGNANGNHADDTTQMQKMMAAECVATKRASAQASCSASLGVPAGDVVVKSCMFDECFGMNVRARARAKTYA